MKQTIYVLVFLCLSCSSADTKNIEPTLNNKIEHLSYLHLDKLSIIGDFDGDGKQDTLFQNTINSTTKIPIDSFPDNQWDSLENYFFKLNADVILTLLNSKYDTLHLGTGSGLYCLINIGDNNKDKKDEIACVLNNRCFTNISSCEIYTLCNNKWMKLKSFKIHENAFHYNTDTLTTFEQIKGFLEFRKKGWFYIDYEDWFNAENDTDTILKPLKIKKGC